ncbi:hypothetical protein CHLRE_16g675050v5 [Chlamydomonas reinhardtii]|uniref:Uncharacterized protein n=1 Tax=Chlamydomonas reinhardtii TaxID=3055 RepID=A0A2K3CVG4_CHLRE|nr:uncharacterized protein CHLRE_16g675050v5 [Chlamydomonas reinhardtii]PNW72271.1 hypothetical protein CHLRE_16g675050v5 [Chlamydomonas reinhardtii]
MPKLSDYLARAKAPATAAAATAGPSVHSESTTPQQQNDQPRSRISGRAEGQLAAPRLPPAPATPAPTSAPAPALLQQLHDRYLEQFRRRLRERGGRCYRYPDGSLRPTPPPADFYSQANRKHWQELVHHARTTGGDPEYQMHGFSLRYGIGVPHEAHQRLCHDLDLQEELQPPLAIGDFEGDPLTDPSHPFNREWKQLADSVFAAAPHPWRSTGAATATTS